MIAGRSCFVAFLPVLWLCLVAPPSTAADVVRLDNGDRLTGEIVSLADGRLRLDTEWAGEIEIGWSTVRSIASDGVLTLELDDGSRLIGRVSTPAPEAGSPGAGAALVHAEGLESPVRLALDRLQAINPPEGGVRFTGSASAGLVTHRGNTETRSLYFEADATARTDTNRSTIGAQASRAEDDGETTADSSRGWIEYDHFVSKRWYLSAGALFTRDEFQDLRLRSSVAASTGYQALETESTDLSLELGGSYVDEDYYETEDGSYPAARWALDARRRLAGGDVELFHTHEGFLDLEQGGDALVRSKTGARFNLFGSLIATTQVSFDYDGDPAPGREKEDWRYLVNLGVGW